MTYNIYANYSNGDRDLVEILEFSCEVEVDKYCEELESDETWYSYELVEE